VVGTRARTGPCRGGQSGVYGLPKGNASIFLRGSRSYACIGSYTITTKPVRARGFEIRRQLQGVCKMPPVRPVLGGQSGKRAAFIIRYADNAGYRAEHFVALMAMCWCVLV